MSKKVLLKDIFMLSGFAILWISVACVLLLSSCGHDPEPDPPSTEVPGDNTDDDDEREEGKAMRTILVYTVSSDLVSDFYDDRDEMISGLQDVDLSKFNWLLYQSVDASDIRLLKAYRTKDGHVEFETIREYDNQTLSTDPKRMSEVFNYVFTEFPATYKGLVMWGHGSSWSFGNNGHVGTEPVSALPSAALKPIDVPSLYAYGGDHTTGRYDWMNLDELAGVIPDNMLDFIWFDNCYMSSVEVMYQMRNKAEYAVAYPTEIYGPGAPYDLIAPLLARKEPNLIDAAKLTFDWYNSDNYACTVCVVDLKKIEPLADVCKDAYTDFTPVKVSDLMRYSRGSHGPYYDLGQYMRRVAENPGSRFDDAAFNQALDDFVLYKAHSARNFSGVTILDENYSGLSVHAYGVSANENDNYYRTLDWYIRTF